jgi:hypothetical protein
MPNLIKPPGNEAIIQSMPDTVSASTGVELEHSTTRGKEEHVHG